MSAVFVVASLASGGGDYVPSARAAASDDGLARIEEALERGQWALARADLDLLLASPIDDADRARALYFRAWLRQGENHPEAALSDIRTIAKLNAPLDIADDVIFLEGELLYALDRFGAAAQTFDKFLFHYPEDPRRLRATWFRAEALSRGAGVAEAEQLYTEFIQRADDGAETQRAYFGRAWCRHEAGRDGEALADFTRAIDGPDRQLAAKARFEAGAACQRLGRLEDARSWLEERRGPVEAAPGRLDLALGQVYFALGDLERAVTHLESAHPHAGADVQPFVLYQLGWARLKLDRPDGAARAFQTLAESGTEVDSLIVAAHYGLGVSRVRLAEVEGAIQAMESVRAAGETRFADEARYVLSYLYNQVGNVDASERVIAELKRSDPNSPLLGGAAIVEGENHFRDQRYEDAVRIFESELANDRSATGDRADLLYRLGISYFQLARFGDAERTLADLILRYPQSPHRFEARFWLAEARYRLDDVAGARREYAAVVAAARRDAVAGERGFDAEYGLAWCDLSDENFEAAHERFDRLVRSGARPDRDADLRLRRGNAAFRLGRTDEAIADFDVILQRHPQSTEASRALERKAWALHRAERYDAARGVFDMVVARDPSPERRVDAQYWSAFSAFKAEKYDAAARAFQAVVDHDDATDSLRVEALFRRAECAFNAGAFDDAAERYRVLTEGDFSPEVRKSAHEALVQSLERTGSTTEVVEAVTELTDEFPEAAVETSDALLRVASEHAAAKRWRDAIEAATSFLESDPDPASRVKAHRVAADAHLELDQPLRAAEHYRDAGHHGDRDDGIEYRFEAGRLFFEAAKYREAEAEFRQVVALRPESSVLDLARYNLGLSLKELDEPADAFKQFDAVAESANVEDTLRAEALLEHGLLARNLDKPAQASKSLCRAAELARGATGAEAQYWCAEIHFDAGRTDEAIAGFRRVVDRFGSQTEWGITARYRLAEAFEQINRWSEAREQYQSIVTSTEDDAWRTDAQERLDWIKENSWVFEEEPAGDPSRW